MLPSNALVYGQIVLAVVSADMEKQHLLLYLQEWLMEADPELNKTSFELEHRNRVSMSVQMFRTWPTLDEVTAWIELTKWRIRKWPN